MYIVISSLNVDRLFTLWKYFDEQMLLILTQPSVHCWVQFQIKILSHGSLQSIQRSL